jgi:hypothetical protein
MAAEPIFTDGERFFAAIRALMLQDRIMSFAG